MKSVRGIMLISALGAVVLSWFVIDRPSHGAPRDGQGTRSNPDQTIGDSKMVRVRVFDGNGQLIGPVDSAKVQLTDEQWKQRLSAEQFQVLRSKGTERPFCGLLLDNKTLGVYTCAGCGLPLFASDTKFQSGTGWPSFFQPIAKENVVQHPDHSHGMSRTEINCARCDGHLGHVFTDGPQPTGMRYCLNSASLNFTPSGKLAELADPATNKNPGAEAKDGNTAQAVFAGGCFWCTEAAFEQLEGVIDAESGYSGGAKETANYTSVCSGKTGHAEAIRITYDPLRISYDQLLGVFFDAHDPTQLNGQGADHGTQYRSAIFFADQPQKEAAEAKIKQLSAAGAYSRPIVTTLEPLTAFYPAEDYHQNYARNNPLQPYIQFQAVPKVCKIRSKHPALIKNDG